MCFQFLRGLALATVVLLCGCASRGIPPVDTLEIQADARALLQQSAEAHGLAAFQGITDINVAYEGEWYGLVGRIQPTLVDPDFRQGSQERIILKPAPIVAQLHTGPKGSKQVLRTAESVTVDYNGQADSRADVLAAAALVADGYRMFLTGPFFFLEGNASLSIVGSESVHGGPCHVLLSVRRPGHGNSAEDRYLLFIDHESHRLHRLRFTMEGLESTRGAVAEVDFFDHQTIAGIVWPTRFYERLIKPIPNLPVHDWRLIGLDVNRGLNAADVSGRPFSSRAAMPAEAFASPGQRSKVAKPESADAN